jgi:predicted O-methyltransferase YrrM
MSTQQQPIHLEQSVEEKISGTLFENVHRLIATNPIAQHFFAGQLSRTEWIDFLESQRTQLLDSGIPAADVDFAKRYPGAIESFVSEAYRGDTFKGLLALPENWTAQCHETAQSLAASFEHQGSTTYIYPEEGYLLQTLVKAFTAKRAIFLGSYYGYWAAWAIPAIQASGGSAVLIDPDERCCDLARHNLTKLYPNAAIEVVCSTGQEYLANYDRDQDGAFDFVVLDAELPSDYPDENLRGKGLYFALLESVLPHIADPSLLVCHNILLHDETGSDVMRTAVELNRKELTPFLKIVGETYQFFTEIHSTEGMGVGVYKVS